MNAASLQARFETAEPFVGTAVADSPKIRATPFRWPEPSSLPRRPWIFGRWLLRDTVCAIVAPGGVGKSSFVASMLLALASGRQSVLGKTVWAGPKTVWYWNLEDGLAELEMQLTAAAMFHRIGKTDCGEDGERIMLDSGPDGDGLCIAVEDRNGFSIAMPIVEALVAELIRRKIDVLVVDPFVSSHAVSENDNVAIDAVAKTWAKIAMRASCAVVLVHHSKKLAGEKVTAEASRGASSLVSAARTTLVLNRMDAAEASRLGIAEDHERRRIFSVQDDKANRAPAEEALWFRLASQDVGNSRGLDDPFGDSGDSVGVVTRWTPPDPFEGVSADHLRRVQAAVAAGEWRHSDQSPQWVGFAVADVLGFPVNEVAGKPKLVDPAAKGRVLKMVAQWIHNDALRVIDGKDDRRKPVKFVVVGEPAVDGAPPSRSGAERGGAGRASDVLHHHPHPVGGGVERSGAGAGKQVEQKAGGAAGPRVVFPAGNPAFRPILAPDETGDEPIPGFDGL